MGISGRAQKPEFSDRVLRLRPRCDSCSGDNRAEQRHKIRECRQKQEKIYTLRIDPCWNMLSSPFIFHSDSAFNSLHRTHRRIRNDHETAILQLHEQIYRIGQQSHSTFRRLNGKIHRNRGREYHFRLSR